MLPYKSMIQLDSNSRMPIYVQLANGIIKEISRGNLVPGLKLPGSRTLASQFEVHRKTIIAAYQELEAQGWIETVPAKGSFVSKKIPVTKPQSFNAQKREIISPLQTSLFSIKKRFSEDVNEMVPKFTTFKYQFDDGLPDLRLAPIQVLARQYKSVLNSKLAAKKLNYTHDLKGNISLRKELAKYLSETRSINVTTENIMIVRGSIMGFYLLFQIILEKGSNVIVGETNFRAANEIIKNAQGKIITVPVDAHGIDVAQVAEICKKKKIRAIYIVPHHHHPTTVSLSAERRMKLLQLAERYKFAIIEDDYDYDFHYESSPILPLASSDRVGVVSYVGSFSKSIAPAFRIGFVVAPEDLIDEMSKLRRFVDRQGDVLLERTIAMMLEEGEVRRHMRKALKTYHQRRDFFCDLLQTELGDFVEFKKPDGGLAVWTKFDKKIDMTKLSEAAAAKNLYIADSKRYDPIGKELNFTRLGFASMNEQEMKVGVKILKGEIEKSFLSSLL